jgi:hypothetical protein
MVKQRGAEAGIADLHPHRLRHTFAHTWLASGGGETDLMRLAGWRSPQMLSAVRRDRRDGAGNRRPPPPQPRRPRLGWAGPVSSIALSLDCATNGRGPAAGSKQGSSAVPRAVSIGGVQ